MEEADEDLGFGCGFSLSSHPPPSSVSLTPFSPSISPSPRRLSSCFSQPSRPVPAARKLAWVSLQGRLVGAEEASSARAIGGGLSRDEAFSWELFSPIHRILIVAVVAVAVAESKKNRQIWQLRKSVELRDQVLSSMQQKLDNLCEQVNNTKDQSDNISFATNVDFGGCGCWHCDQHRGLSKGTIGNSVAKLSRGDEMLQYKLPLTSEVEPEERRMSDLSDWASSVTSSADIQMNTLAIEQDIYNLKRDCEEKDATIKELSTFLHSSNVTGSKRIAELEDIIRRKNMIITKLKKDMMVLEQKVQHFTRLQRPSFSASSSSSTNKFPLLLDNLVYDMDSTTSPSSSDSDGSGKGRALPHVAKIQIQNSPAQNNEFVSMRNQKSEPIRPRSSSKKQTNQYTRSRPVSPLKEKSMNQRCDTISSLRPNQLSAPSKQLSVSGELRKSRRRTQSKDTAQQKRWF